ncbi:MAG: cysteine peptidase family C39 domain-containing protein [Planctomycetota bacterium]
MPSARLTQTTATNAEDSIPPKLRLAPRVIGLVLALIPSFACAVGPTRPPALSSSATVLPTPLVEQDELHECGLAAIASLCGYYQVAIPAPARAELARLAEERAGLSGTELRATLEGLGFEVFIFAGTFDRTPTGVLSHLEEGRPLLVMTADDSSNHFSLLIGHDPELANVVLLDPRRGRVLLPNETFQTLWGAVRCFTLLAVPATPLPSSVAHPTPFPETSS